MTDNMEPMVPQGASEAELEEMELKKQQSAERRAKHGGEEKVSLTITSLLDIMTIMLVFLLVSVTSDPLNVKLGADMQLAGSTADITPMSDSIAIQVTKGNIIVDSKNVVDIRCQIGGEPCTVEDWEKMNRCEDARDPGDAASGKAPSDGRFDPICVKEVRFFVDKQDKEGASKDSMVIEPLRKALEQLVKRQMDEDEQLGRKFKGVVTLVADKEIPYSLLMEVLYTAGRVGVKGKGGLSQFRFAIKKM